MLTSELLAPPPTGLWKIPVLRPPWKYHPLKRHFYSCCPPTTYPLSQTLEKQSSRIDMLKQGWFHPYSSWWLGECVWWKGKEEKGLKSVLWPTWRAQGLPRPQREGQRPSFWGSYWLSVSLLVQSCWTTLFYMKLGCFLHYRKIGGKEMLLRMFSGNSE
jgi:hypothetical protein